MGISLESAAHWMTAAYRLIEADADRLTDLDRRIGDADHGLNMNRGFREVAALDPGDYPDAAAYLKKVGMTLVSKVGGASGPLYGTFFLRVAGALATNAEATFANALAAGIGGIEQRGKARVGEKTMLDALVPALETARAGGDDAIGAAVAAAQAGADATVDMVATKGRASYLGERSRGTMDPGAASAVLILRAASEAMTR